MSFDVREEGLALSRGEALGVIDAGKILKESRTRGEGDAGRGRD
jgi:hypothetical protein